MKSDGEASGPTHGLDHQALIYGDDGEFIHVALPFIEEGLSLGQPTLAAVQDRHLENLRGALGGTPEGLTLHSVEDWYETSARTRDKFARWVAEETERGGRTRLMGEPPWALGHEAQVRDWARHESVINVALAGEPVTFICPYDARALPEDVIGHAVATHPKLVDGTGTSRSPSYEDPVDFCRRLDSAVAAQSGEPVLEMEFGLDDLATVRRAIGSFVLDAGLAAERAEELVLALNEITTNAVIHASPPASVRAWSTNGEIVIEVKDAGAGIHDALAGQLAPHTARLGGRGLWLTRLLCDAVEVRNGEGCTVVMHAAAPSRLPVTAA